LKILITGGCGFVGANLCLYLKKKKFQINSLDNLSRKGSKFNLNLLKKAGIKNYKVDISNSYKISKLPKYDIIIDCCAEASVEVSKKDIDRVINTNLIGTVNILKKIKKDNGKLIFISSSRVYSIEKLNSLVKNNKNIKSKIKIKKKINENFNKSEPKSIYGLSKYASEMFIEEFSYAFGVKYIINRCGVISGPLQFGKQDQGFVSLWIWRHMNNKKLSYIGYGGNGYQVRDVLHISDLGDLVYMQIKKFNIKFNNIFTVGGSNTSCISLKELTKKCELITSNKLKIKKQSKTSIYDIPYFVTDNTNITKAYNWKPKRNMDKIIFDTHNWLLKNKKQLKKYL